MSRTRYSEQDRSHTEVAHLAAREQIYPTFFDCQADKIEYRDGIDYITKQGNQHKMPMDWLDSWMSIDRILRIPAPLRLGYVEVTIQERFERASAASHRNISVTEFNVATGNPSELYKIKSLYFVSGYFDQSTNKFVGKTHICNTERILKAVAEGRLRYYTKPNHKNQDFVTFGYEDLMAVDAVLMAFDFRHDPPIITTPGNAVQRALDEAIQTARETSRQQAVLMGMLKELIDRTPARKAGRVLHLAGAKDLFADEGAA
jgi:hypothetical protein